LTQLATRPIPSVNAAYINCNLHAIHYQRLAGLYRPTCRICHGMIMICVFKFFNVSLLWFTN